MKKRDLKAKWMEYEDAIRAAAVRKGEEDLIDKMLGAAGMLPVRLPLFTKYLTRKEMEMLYGKKKKGGKKGRGY